MFIFSQNETNKTNERNCEKNRNRKSIFFARNEWKKSRDGDDFQNLAIFFTKFRCFLKDFHDVFNDLFKTIYNDPSLKRDKSEGIISIS